MSALSLFSPSKTVGFAHIAGIIVNFYQSSLKQLRDSCRPLADLR